MQEKPYPVDPNGDAPSSYSAPAFELRLEIIEDGKTLCVITKGDAFVSERGSREIFMFAMQPCDDTQPTPPDYPGIWLRHFSEVSQEPQTGGACYQLWGHWVQPWSPTYEILNQDTPGTITFDCFERGVDPTTGYDMVHFAGQSTFTREDGVTVQALFDVKGIRYS